MGTFDQPVVVVSPLPSLHLPMLFLLPMLALLRRLSRRRAPVLLLSQEAAKAANLLRRWRRQEALILLRSWRRQEPVGLLRAQSLGAVNLLHLGRLGGYGYGCGYGLHRSCKGLGCLHGTGAAAKGLGLGTGMGRI